MSYPDDPGPSGKPRLTTDSDKRKEIPLASGCLDYFPDALAAVAELSMEGNKKHNPGEPLHWERSKSTDEADCLMRHFLERGTVDTDGIRHSVKVAWRALAMAQKEIEEAKGLPISRGSRDAREQGPSHVLKPPYVVAASELRVGDRVRVEPTDKKFASFHIYTSYEGTIVALPAESANFDCDIRRCDKYADSGDGVGRTWRAYHQYGNVFTLLERPGTP